MQNEKIKKVERIFCIVTGVIALGLIIAAFINYIFVPAACTMLALCFNFFFPLLPLVVVKS